MRLKTRTRLLIPLLSTFSMGAALAGHGQDIANNGYKPLFASSRQLLQSETMVIPLKDAVNQWKSFYKIKVAYKEGLLDSKIVPAAITGSFRNMDAETALKQLFLNTSLSYKKIGNNQFSVFEPRVSNPLPGAEIVSCSHSCKWQNNSRQKMAAACPR